MEQNKQDLITFFGLESFDQETQESMLARIGTSIGKLVTAQSISELSSEDTATLQMMQEQGASLEQIIGFLSQKVPNFQSIAQSVASDVQKTLQS